MAEAKLSILLKMKDEASKQLEGFTGKLKDHSNQIRMVGIAFTAAGAAGLKMVADARKVNAQLGQTAITIGSTTAELRGMVLAITDVTFGVKSVTATFELLARAGVKDTEIMKKSALAFDALADATGSSAEVLAEMLIPAYKMFGEELPTTAAEMDKWTWLVKSTTINLTELGGVMGYVAAYGQDLNLTSQDLIVVMKALSEQGMSAADVTRLLRTAINQAEGDVRKLYEILGVTTAEISRYSEELTGTTGITREYADEANKQFGIMDKVKQKFDELTLSAGSFLTPLEPILALMTALGPVMIFLSTTVGIATVKTIAHTVALVAQKIALLGVTAASLAAIPAIAALSTVLLPVLAALAVFGGAYALTTLSGLPDIIGDLIEGAMGGAQLTPYAEGILGYANGGIVTRPTLAMVGEKGPEAVVPLRGGLGTNVTVNAETNPTLIKTIAGAAIYGLSKLIPSIEAPKIPAMQAGGVVTRPTLAMVGERGPEAVVPLSRGGMGTNVTVNVGGSVISDRDLVSYIRSELLDIQSRNYNTGLT